MLLIITIWFTPAWVFAGDGKVFPQDDLILDVAPEEIYDKYVNENNLNSISTRAIYNIYLNVPIFNQGDSHWKDDIMQTEGATIGAKGCALTSVAMSFKYHTVDTNPKILNQDLGQYACPIYWYEAPPRGGDGKVELVTYHEPSSINEFYNIAVGALEDGNPVIIGMTKPSGGTHFVIVKAVYGDGVSPDDYTVNDPNGGVVKKLDYYIEDLNWYIHRIVVYGRK